MSTDDKMKDIFGEDSESEQENNESNASGSEQQNDASENDNDNESSTHNNDNENNSDDENNQGGTPVNAESDNEENGGGNQSSAESEQQQQNGSDVEGSDDEDNIKPKKAKTVDVFGDALDDLSGDSDANEENENDESTARDKTGADEIEEVEEPEQLINVDIGRVKADLGKEIHFVKLPNFLSVEPKPFDPEFYEDESAGNDELDEEGKTRVKLKVENTIRWRNAKDDEGNTIKESNAKIVRWSDGSLSMHLGNEIFDVTKPVMQGDHNHFFIRQGTCLLGQAVFKTKLTFRPHSTDSLTHRKMTMSLVDRGSKMQKVKILTDAVKNPEEKRAEMIKKEEEKLRAASRRENQQRRIREKSYSKQITSSYLEDRYSDEDESISISAIKSKFKDGKNEGRTSIYSSGDESDRERRLNKAKLSDDDSDDDRKMTNKKKKKLVADDDE